MRAFGRTNPRKPDIADPIAGDTVGSRPEAFARGFLLSVLGVIPSNRRESRPSLPARHLAPPSLACCGRQPLRRFSIILTTDVIASDSAANTTTPAKTISTW
jgi:hypothetical protein